MTVEVVAESSVPDELTNHHQWVGWTKKEKGDREIKLPLSTDGEAAKTNDESTWSKFRESIEYAEENETGIGFVFSEDDPYVGVDLDHCRDPETGEIDGWAREIVDKMESYTDISPSGTGLHIIAKSENGVPEWWTNIKEEGKGIEVYDSSRFFTVTGERVDGTPEGCNFVDDFVDLLEDIRENNVEETQNTDETDTQDSEFGIYDVLNEAQYPRKEKTSHPYHPSQTGSNFEVDENGETWRCWRHETTGNAHHLVGVREGIIECGDWDSRDITDREWSKIYDAIESEDVEIADKIIESPESWINLEDKTVTVQRGEYGYSQIKRDLKNRDIPQSGFTEILASLDSKYADAFREFWEGGNGWSVEIENSEDEWESIRSLYSSSQRGSKREGRDRTVRKLREEFELATLEKTEELLYYDEETGIHRENGERAVRERLENRLKSCFKKREVNEILYRLKSKNILSRDAFDSHDKVCVGNGVLDLETGELEPHSPDYRFLSRIQADYDEDADCPKFREFLDDVCPDKYIPMVQEYVGYCLQPDTDRKKALMIFGTTDAGKSVFLDTVQALFGDESTANQSIQYLVNERWGIAELQGKSINVRHDLDASAIKNVGRVKELIAGNPMKGEKKNRDPFKMEPSTKHIFSANQAPERSTEDDGFWNRWLTVIFPESVPKEEQDPYLTEKLTQEDELSGILNWAIEGYQRLQEQGEFTNEPESWENRNRWESYGNSVEQFLDARLDRSQTSYETKEDVYDAYKEFARQQGMEVVTMSKLTREMKKKDGITDGQRTVNGDRERVYEGVQMIQE